VHHKDIQKVGNVCLDGRLLVVPEFDVAKTALYAHKCNIPHLGRWGMLRFALWNAVFATPASG
jgi:hypothetical protein